MINNYSIWSGLIWKAQNMAYNIDFGKGEIFTHYKCTHIHTMFTQGTTEKRKLPGSMMESKRYTNSMFLSPVVSICTSKTSRHCPRLIHCQPVTKHA